MLFNLSRLSYSSRLCIQAGTRRWQSCKRRKATDHMLTTSFLLDIFCLTFQPQKLLYFLEHFRNKIISRNTIVSWCFSSMGWMPNLDLTKLLVLSYKWDSWADVIWLHFNALAVWFSQEKASACQQKTHACQSLWKITGLPAAQPWWNIVCKSSLT